MEDLKVKITWIVFNGGMDMKIKTYTVIFKTEKACKMYDDYSGSEGHKLNDFVVMKPDEYDAFEQASVIAGLTKTME